MRHQRRAAGAGATIIIALGGLAGLVAWGPACTADTSGLGDDDDVAGQGGGVAGRAGLGGTGGGAPPAGTGGGGGGGAAPCDRARLLVVQPGFAAPLDPTLAGACRFAALDPALAALVPGTTKRLALYGQNAAASAPLVLPAGLTFEGHTADPAQPLALAVTPAEGKALVTLGDGAVVKGVALEGGTAAPAGVRVTAGSARLEGPLRLRGLSPALSVEGTAKATVAGTKAAAVVVTENVRGIVVGATAGLEVGGEGGQSVVLEKTGRGAALLVEKGEVTAKVTVRGAHVADNLNGDPDGGTGGIEVRQGRQVLVQGCLFARNSASVVLNGQSSSMPASFAGVTLADNDFKAALPAADAGTALCGSNLGSRTQLTLGAGNLLPSGTLAEAATCAALNDGQQGTCNGGADVGYDTAEGDFALSCQ